MPVVSRFAIQILVLLFVSFGLTKLLVNQPVAERFSGLNAQFNDLLVVNSAHPESSDSLVVLGVKSEEAKEYFGNRTYAELKKILAQVMNADPALVIATFLPHTDNVPESELSHFTKFTNQYQNLYFYSWYEPGDVEHWSRHKILKDLKSIFLPLTADRGISPYDARVRRMVVDYTWNNFSYLKQLFELLNAQGFARSPKDFKTFRFLDSDQVHVRYRGADAYSRVTLKDIAAKPNLIRGKIVILGPSDHTWEDQRYRAVSVYPNRWLPSKDRVALIVDTLISKDPVARTTDGDRRVITFALFAFYFAGLLYLGPIAASVWGLITIFLWLLVSIVAYQAFAEFVFLLEVAVGLGAIHFFAAPTLLIRYLRIQDHKTAEQQRQIELQNLRSSLVVKSARAEMGLKIATQVAHDIRGPLGAIGIATQMRGEANSDEISQLLSSSVERLQRISDDLLKRFRSGEFFKQDVAEIALRPWLTQLLEGYRLAWPGVSLTVSGDETAAITVVDRSALERAFSNMLNNAIEACSQCEAPRIAIKIESDADTYLVHILDNGPGVPSEIADRLFQRGATFGKSGGSGLGLTQVRETVENLGGTVELVPSGQGAHFKLTLPKPQNRRGHLKVRRKVVVVEDNSSIRAHWQTRLTTAGAHVTAVASPEEFDQLKLGPDVTVITDLIFETSDRTGFNILEACKNWGCHAILCSSLGGNAEIQSMARPLADLVLTKNQFDLMTLSIDT